MQKNRKYPKILFAPLEGITTPVFREVHHMMFPGVTAYYAPFLAPDREGTFKPGFLQSRLPDNLKGIPLIPQLLCNDPNSFLITARKLQDLGYHEINLNAGCPSPTVFSKHKGAGMLSDLSTLKSFLDAVFSAAENMNLKISIKTRMGVSSVSEFPEILDIYNQYPVSLLIVHARDKNGQYFSVPDQKAFSEYAERSVNPICYNGEIFSWSDMRSLTELMPDPDWLMIGRGSVANPALTRILRGGEALRIEELKGFHDEILSRNLEQGLAPNFAVQRMKELWFYMSAMFPGSARLLKLLNKSRSIEDYCSAVSAVFSGDYFEPDAVFPGTRKE